MKERHSRETTLRLQASKLWFNERALGSNLRFRWEGESEGQLSEGKVLIIQRMHLVVNSPK